MLEASAIPVHPVTEMITSALGLDAMRLISSGTLLIATPEQDNVMAKLAENKVPCTVIGKFTDTGYLVNDKSGKLIPLLPPDADELYKL